MPDLKEYEWNRGEAIGDGIGEEPGPRSCSKAVGHRHHEEPKARGRNTNLFSVHV